MDGRTGLARQRSTVGCRRVRYYRFAHIDGRITSNPAQYVRRPRVHPPAQRGMDRGELASFLYTAERTSPMHAALAVLLGLNGLRVSEACGTNIEDLGFERGHRILRIVGKGTKPAGIPLVPRTARTVDLAIGERSQGPILLRHNGERLDTRTAYRWVRSVGEQAGLDRVHPHMLRAAFVMAACTPGFRWATCDRRSPRPGEPHGHPRLALRSRCLPPEQSVHGTRGSDAADRPRSAVRKRALGSTGGG